MNGNRRLKQAAIREQSQQSCNVATAGAPVLLLAQQLFDRHPRKPIAFGIYIDSSSDGSSNGITLAISTFGISFPALVQIALAIETYSSGWLAKIQWSPLDLIEFE
jgi:hypothetical protein